MQNIYSAKQLNKGCVITYVILCYTMLIFLMFYKKSVENPVLKDFNLKETQWQ